MLGADLLAGTSGFGSVLRVPAERWRAQKQTAAVAAASVAADPKEKSKALVAAYDGRREVQGLRSGEQCCWGVKRCVRAQEIAPREGGSWAVGSEGVDEPLMLVQRREEGATAVGTLAW